MNRTEFQRLADLRQIEGRALLDAGHYAGAYYLLGYAVECALKACIAKKTNAHDFPPKRSVVEEVYTHNLSKLLNQSGLGQDFQQARRNDPQLEKNWTIVQDWSEEFRYDLNVSETTARDFYSAVSQTGNGVLPWFRNWW